MANIATSADQTLTTREALQDRFRRGHQTAEPEKELYFLAGAGLIKIGITTNLVSRVRAIRNSSPIPLELLAIKPSTGFQEALTHEKFKHLRRHGEWFEDNGEIREWIAVLIGTRQAALAPDRMRLRLAAAEMRNA